jgi:Ca-activated chloride channel homolog
MIYNWLQEIQFERPWVLGFLALLPLLAWFSFKFGKGKTAAVRISHTGSIRSVGFKVRFRFLPNLLRYLCLAALIVALARPRSFNDLTMQNNEGIDIMLCIDISGSMNAIDLAPSRLVAAKEVAANFVNQRPYDRIGLVLFAGEAFTACPVTTNQDFLLKTIYETESNSLTYGTHIGEGLGSSVSGLEKSKAKSKVVILLTDGVNDPNGQDVSPQDASELAKALGIRVYTIGAGVDGRAPIPEVNEVGDTVIKYMENAIDEPLLKTIAKETGGQFFRARDLEALKNVYAEIDKMEKVKIESTRYRKYRERYHIPLWFALGCLFLELILRYTVFRKFP